MGTDYLLAQFRDPGDIQRVEEGSGVRYKRVMLLSPGVWTDAGSGQTVDYSADGIRASADNFVDMDKVRERVPEWEDLPNDERAARLRDLGDAVLAEEIPLNFLHGPSLYGADSLDEVGTIPRDSIIVDDDGGLYGDLVLAGDSSQSETTIDLMDEVLEQSQSGGERPPPVGPSVEIPADDVDPSDRGLHTLEEAWFSGVGIVFNPASRPVELGNQATQRAVAMQADDDNGGALLYRSMADEPTDGDSLIASLRQRWRMGDENEGGDTPDFDDMNDEELRRTLETMKEDMGEIEKALQGEDELAELATLIEQYEAAGNDPSEPASAFVSWVDAETDVDPASLQGALDAYLEAVDAESLEETPVEGLADWIEEMGGGGGDGDGGDDGDGNPGDEPSMEDLQNVKDTLGQFADHMSDIKDLLTAREEDREAQFEELERRLSDIEDEPVIKSLTDEKEEPFIKSDGETPERQHEDVLL